MSFNAMAKYNHNDPVEYIWAVAKNGLVPVRKYKVVKETPKTYVLEDGNTVHKNTMNSNYQLFFTSEVPADVVYRNIRSVFDPSYADPKTNFDCIKDASLPGLSNVLFDMIQELCEDGMPTKEDIEEWLKSAVEKVEE